jgi:hypothetical protein
MSDTNTPDDASDNQDIELPDQLTQAEFDTYIDHDQDTAFFWLIVVAVIWLVISGHCWFF